MFTEYAAMQRCILKTDQTIQLQSPESGRNHLANRLGMVCFDRTEFFRNEVAIMLDKIALILTTIGGINWGLVGLFRFDFFAFLFGGSDTLLARIVYVLLAVSSIWCISLLFRENEILEERRAHKYNT